MKTNYSGLQFKDIKKQNSLELIHFLALRLVPSLAGMSTHLRQGLVMFFLVVKFQRHSRYLIHSGSIN